MRPRPRMWVTAAWLLVLPLTAFAGGQPAALAKPEEWQPALLERWLSSVEQHRPGELDSALLEATHWTRADLRRLWIDVQVLLRVVAQPRDTRFRVVPLDSPRSGSPVTIAPTGAARAQLEVLADRVRKADPRAVMKRAAIVHTDVATLAANLVSTDGEAMPMTAGVMMLVGDGRPGGAASISVHWNLGRLLVELLHSREPGGVWARDWYRATIGLGQRVESFDSNHLRHALRVIPDDAWLRFLEGCQHEAMAASLFQEFARPLRGTAMRPDMRSEDDELGAAATAFREALRIDPTLTEARLRLGRVRGRQGRHADAVEELRRAAAELTEPLLQYYAQLFLALEYEALDDMTAAAASYAQAAASAPQAPLPRLALARLAQSRGDRETHVVNLDQALAPRSEPQDPWWFYRGSQARHADRWLTEVRKRGDAAGAMKGVLLLVAGLSLHLASLAAQPPTFSSRVEGVRIDVLVSSGGRPLPGLQAADFEVRDQGVLQPVTLVSQADLPLSVVLTLDLSSSVTEPQLAALRQAGLALLDGLVDGDNAGLVTFDHRVTEPVPLTAEVDKVRAALEATTPQGDTALIDAAAAAMLRGDAQGGRTLVVLFSDGVDTASLTPPERVLDTARRVNGIVYAVWAGEGDPRFLRDLSRVTGGRVIDIGKGGNPRPAFVEILREFRSRYLLTYTPAGVAPGGWHELDVRVSRRGARVDARPGYFSARP